MTTSPSHALGFLKTLPDATKVLRSAEVPEPFATTALNVDLLKSTAMRSRAIGVAGADMLHQVYLLVSVSGGSVNPNSRENMRMV